MTWHYSQKTGWLDKDGILVSKTCHADFESLPEGLWTISGPPFSGDRGPYCLRLTPQKGTITFGRDNFLICGVPGLGIVADRVTRERIYQSGDTDLAVISGTDKEES